MNKIICFFLGHVYKVIPECGYVYKHCARCNKDLSKNKVTILQKQNELKRMRQEKINHDKLNEVKMMLGGKNIKDENIIFILETVNWNTHLAYNYLLKTYNL